MVYGELIYFKSDFIVYWCGRNHLITIKLSISVMIILSRWLPALVWCRVVSVVRLKETRRDMIFNPDMTREAICGLEVTPEQLAEFDKEMGEIEESASPKFVSTTTSPRTPAKRKRSRFAIESPEKILEEARRKEEENEVSNVSQSTRKNKSAGRRKKKRKYKK